MSNPPLLHEQDLASPEPTVETRPPMTASQAAELMGLFKAFANDRRLRLLHALVREDVLYVNELAERLGMKPQAERTYTTQN